MPKIAEIERTPNPNAMRLVISEPISQGITRSYENAEQAEKDPFATLLFAIPSVISVYYVDSYVTVTQDGSSDWNELLRKLAPPIREAEPIGMLESDDDEVHASKEAMESDDPRLVQINKMLDEQVRPYLLADGGGLKVLGLDDNNVIKVHYQGACGTCPTATRGTLYDIESMVRRIDPEIVVQSV
ncbi:MAG: NifU N-terminal domain-containing protein [Balneolales bacterium]|nr:NifU N-terminal domain-containing protein [Balneolales bacterium]